MILFNFWFITFNLYIILKLFHSLKIPKSYIILGYSAMLIFFRICGCSNKNFDQTDLKWLVYTTFIDIKAMCKSLQNILHIRPSTFGSHNHLKKICKNSYLPNNTLLSKFRWDQQEWNRYNKSYNSNKNYGACNVIFLYMSLVYKFA